MRSTAESVRSHTPPAPTVRSPPPMGCPVTVSVSDSPERASMRVTEPSPWSITQAAPKPRSKKRGNGPVGMLSHGPPPILRRSTTLRLVATHR